MNLYLMNPTSSRSVVGCVYIILFFDSDLDKNQLDTILYMHVISKL